MTRKFGDPTTADVHVDTPLSEIAIAYKNLNFIADRVFPIIPVDKQSDKYFVWDKGSFLTNQVEVRTPGDTYPEGRIKISTDEYYCDLYHLGYAIPDENVKNQDAAVELEQTGSEWLAHQFALNREIQIAAAIFAASVWDSDLTGGTDFTQWDDYVNSDPITDIDTYSETIEQNTGATPNTLVIGRQAWNHLRRHPLLLDMYKHTGVAILNEQQVADALDVETVVVGRATQRTSLEGAATAVQAYVWGKHALLLYVPPNPGLRVPSAGYTFAWKIDDTGLTVNIIPVRQDDRDRDFLKGKHAFDFKVTGTDLGAYFGSAVA
jgi:hypothetical protein